MGSKQKTEIGTSSFVDLFDLDHDRYKTHEESDEVVEEGEGGVDKVEQSTKEKDLTPEAEEIPNDGDGGSAIGDADDPDSEEDGDGKQAAEQSEEEEEDAPSEEQDEEEGATQEEGDNDFAELLQSLADDGTLAFNEEGEYEPSEEGLRALINETKEAAAKEAVEGFKGTVGDEGKELLDILEKGGSVKDFLSIKSQPDFANIPIEDKSGNPIVQNQANLVEDWMREQGFEDEDIDEKIRELHEAGLLQKESLRAKKKLAEFQQKKNEELIAQKEQEKIAREKEEQEMQEAFKDEILNTREIAGFKINKKQAEQLYDYVTKPVGPEGETKFSQDDNVQSRLLYAYFAMSGFNKDKLSKEIATKQALKLKKGLSNYQDKNTKPKGGEQQVKKENDGNAPKINWSFI